MYGHYGRRFHLHDPSNAYIPPIDPPEDGVGFDKKKLKRLARMSIVRKRNREYITNRLVEDNFEGETRLRRGYDYPKLLQAEEGEDDLPLGKFNGRKFFRGECRRIVLETEVKMKEDEMQDFLMDLIPNSLLDASDDGK
jgi:hypothetical protein